MKITYTYSVGDIVDIKPYNIFNDPTPIEWNTDVVGLGNEYQPGQTFEYESPLTLYGQHHPVKMTYHMISAVSESQLAEVKSSFVNRCGDIVEVASFDIDGFRCWHDLSGNVVEIGSRIKMLDDTDLYMSCNWRYQLEYNPNGGQGEKHHAYSERHAYFSNKQMKVTEAEVKLEDFGYTYNDKMSFDGYQIEDVSYKVGNIVTLYHDLTAYARWKLNVQYILNCQIKLVNNTSSFRYLLVKISSAYNGGRTLSMARVQFLDSQNQAFEYPSSIVGKSKNVEMFRPYHDIANAMKSNSSGAVFDRSVFPCYVMVDLGSPCLNITQFNHWKFFSSIDADAETIPSKFQLYLSNDGLNWYFADECNDAVTRVSSSSMKYESQEIAPASESTIINIDSGSSPMPEPQPKDEYAWLEAVNGNGAVIDTGYVPDDNTVIEFEIAPITTDQQTNELMVGIPKNEDNNYRFYLKEQYPYFNFKNQTTKDDDAFLIPRNIYTSITCDNTGMSCENYGADNQHKAFVCKFE